MIKEIKLPHLFRPRDYQIDAWEALDKGAKRVVCCWHRGAGKDLFALNYLIGKAMREPGIYLHCFPKYNQAKRAIWKSVHDTDLGDPVAYLDHFPEELIKSKNGSEMSIELINGSVYHLMGMDGKNAAVARGMNPKFVIMSEYAFMDRSAWDTIEPRVSQNNGVAIFVSTPNGRNHFYDLYNFAKSGHKDAGDYFASLLTIDDTSVYEANFISQKREEGMPEDFIQQEYFCSFNRGAQGSYYGKQIQRARDEDRITNLTLCADLPVHSAWDIGIGDSTAIFLFQILKNNKINVLHYYENTSEGLEHYLRYLDRWKAKTGAIFGSHYVPHDMQNREFTSGVDRLSAARALGYTMQVVPRKGIEEGIQAVRALLPHCSFDAKECARGIKCLDFYRKKWNDALETYYDEPLHDQYSHGCFIGDTKITMQKGMKNISDICIGDSVKTPLGYRRVLNIFKYKTNQLLKISTGKGREIHCTPNHKIFTETKLAYADTLCYTDTLIDESISGDNICKKYNGCHGEKIDLGFRDYFLLMKQKTESYSMDIHIPGMDSIIKGVEEIDCIAKFGNILMDLFRKAIISITSTIMPAIMTFQTCNALKAPNICDLAQNKTSGLEAKQTNSNAFQMQKNLENGTKVNLGANGTKNMQSILGEYANGTKLYVKFAENKSIPHILHLLRPAQIIAALCDAIKAVWTTLCENVKTVIKNLQSINTKSSEHVTEIVVQHLDEPIDVYDFEVEEDHCYYANGILVSNSDAFRMLAVGINALPPSGGSMTPEKITEMRIKHYGY